MSKADDKNNHMIVYGHDYCAQARVLAKALAEHKIDHEYRDVVKGKPIYKNQLKKLARGNLSVPTVVFPDGTVMVEPWPNQVLDHVGHEESGIPDKISGWFRSGE